MFALIQVQYWRRIMNDAADDGFHLSLESMNDRHPNHAIFLSEVMPLSCSGSVPPPEIYVDISRHARVESKLESRKW